MPLPAIKPVTVAYLTGGGNPNFIGQLPVVTMVQAQAILDAATNYLNEFGGDFFINGRQVITDPVGDASDIRLEDLPTIEVKPELYHRMFSRVKSWRISSCTFPHGTDLVNKLQDPSDPRSFITKASIGRLFKADQVFPDTYPYETALHNFIYWDQATIESDLLGSDLPVSLQRQPLLRGHMLNNGSGCSTEMFLDEDESSLRRLTLAYSILHPPGLVRSPPDPGIRSFAFPMVIWKPDTKTFLAPVDLFLVIRDLHFDEDFDLVGTEYQLSLVTSPLDERAEVGTLTIQAGNDPAPLLDATTPIYCKMTEGDSLPAGNITIKPLDWWEYSTKTAEPVYNKLTGIQLRDPFS